MSEIDVANCIYYQECIQFEDGEEIYHICNNDKNTTTYCQDSYNCYYKQLQQLKQENEELKENYRLSCLKCKFKNAFMILDEIEKVCQNISIKHLFKDRLELAKFILQKIKQAKEN